MDVDHVIAGSNPADHPQGEIMGRKVKDTPSKSSVDPGVMKEAIKAVKHREYLKMDQLKAGYLYRIRARNASYGIWLPQRQGFVISRIKFGNNYLFEEYHWDCEAFATVKPFEEIERSPFDAEKINIEHSEKDGKKFFGYPKWKEILKYLNEFEPREHFFELLSREEQDEIRKSWKSYR